MMKLVSGRMMGVNQSAYSPLDDDKGTNEKESFYIAPNPFVVDFDIL